MGIPRDARRSSTAVCRGNQGACIARHAAGGVPLRGGEGSHWDSLRPGTRHTRRHDAANRRRLRPHRTGDATSYRVGQGASTGPRGRLRRHAGAFRRSRSAGDGSDPRRHQFSTWLGPQLRARDWGRRADHRRARTRASYDSVIVTLLMMTSPAGGTPLAAGSGLKSAAIAFTAVSRPDTTSPKSE